MTTHTIADSVGGFRAMPNNPMEVSEQAGELNRPSYLADVMAGGEDATYCRTISRRLLVELRLLQLPGRPSLHDLRSWWREHDQGSRGTMGSSRIREPVTL